MVVAYQLGGRLGMELGHRCIVGCNILGVEIYAYMRVLPGVLVSNIFAMHQAAERTRLCS